ncbi:MAG: hypothetical protein GY776_04550 [Alteromonas sp.]|nr:hypothetical protein [Alteromonas sp.]
MFDELKLVELMSRAKDNETPEQLKKRQAAFRKRQTERVLKHEKQRKVAMQFDYNKTYDI